MDWRPGPDVRGLCCDPLPGARREPHVASSPITYIATAVGSMESDGPQRVHCRLDLPCGPSQLQGGHLGHPYIGQISVSVYGMGCDLHRTPLLSPWDMQSF